MAHNVIPGVFTVTNAPQRPQRHTPNWLKAVYAFVATLVAIMALSLTLAPSGSGDSLPPCKYEDSTSCYWDADTMGNGKGQDVVNR